MKTTLLRIGLLGGLMSIGFGLAGCSKSSSTTDASNSGTMAPPPVKIVGGQKSAPGVPDMNTYPAPEGVKTGTEGGRK